QGRRDGGRGARRRHLDHRCRQPRHGGGRDGGCADRRHRGAARAGPVVGQRGRGRRAAARSGGGPGGHRRHAGAAAERPDRGTALAGAGLMAAVRSVVLRDPDATAALGAALAATAPPGAVVHLQGDLGAGKSTLARAWLRALGVTGPVRSPTYTLVERYPLASGGEALHLDLYRIGDAGELEF